MSSHERQTPVDPPSPPDGERTGEHRTEPVSVARIIGSTLDGLVRSCRVESPSVLQIAGRLLERWDQIPDCVLRLEPTALYIADQEILTAQEDDGRWLLPAFMAGVKTIQLADDTRPEDVVRFASELAALNPTLASIGRLRDWLWAEGAEGFEILLDHGFVDGLDASMTEPVRQRALLEALRSQGSIALAMQAERIASRDLDAAAARDEFYLPLESFSRMLSDGDLSLPAEESSQLAARCDDSLFWIDAQVHLAFAHPELQAQVPAERLARRALALVRGGATARFLNFLSEIMRRREPYARKLQAALDTPEAGEALGTHAVTDERSIEALAPLLAAPASALTRALANTLLERCTGSRESLQWLARLMSTVGFEAFCGKVDASQLTERCAVVMGRLLAASRAPLHPVADLLAHVPPATGVRLATTLPPEILFRLKQPVLKLIGSASLKDAESLLAHLAAQQQNDWGEVVGEVLVASRGEEWPLPVVRTACALVTARGHAPKFLVPLVQDRHVGDDIKLTVLRFIERDPRAVAMLGTMSLGSLFQSREVRERLKELRRRQEEKS